MGFLLWEEGTEKQVLGVDGGGVKLSLSGYVEGLEGVENAVVAVEESCQCP